MHTYVNIVYERLLARWKSTDTNVNNVSLALLWVNGRSDRLELDGIFVTINQTQHQRNILLTSEQGMIGRKDLMLLFNEELKVKMDLRGSLILDLRKNKPKDC